MNFQNIGVFYEAGRKALAAYGMEDGFDLSLLHRSENVSFQVIRKHSNDIDAVLRVSRPDTHSCEELEAEICWRNQIIKDTDVIIARPIGNRMGRMVTTVSHEEKIYYCVMCEYLTGEAPNPFHRERGLIWFKQVGETAAILHEQAMNWTGGRNLPRPVWDYEAILGEKALFGDWRLCRELGKEGYEMLCRACGIIKRRLESYGMEEERFGLIHSDLRSANLLVEGEQMKVLDFDDCGYGWHLHDLAASVSFVEDSSLAGAWVDAWIQGYGRRRRLDKKDYEEIGTFIMARRIQLLAWIISHGDSDPVKTYYDGFAERTLSMAEVFLGRRG